MNEKRRYSRQGSVARSCGKSVITASSRRFWTNIDRETFAQLAAEQVADLSRTALRVYDG
jgi:hypothetical protein